MSARVWKFAVPMPDEFGRAFIDMPAQVTPLSVGMQAGSLVCWALVDPDAEPDEHAMAEGPRRLIVANTGMEVPRFPDGARFLGTAVSPSGVVWHVWDGDWETTA